MFVHFQGRKIIFQIKDYRGNPKRRALSGILKSEVAVSKFGKAYIKERNLHVWLANDLNSTNDQR